MIDHSIIYDGHIFRWQKAGGIRRYFSEIITRLPAKWVPVVLGVEKSTDVPDRTNLKIGRLSRLRPRKMTQPLKTAWWQIAHFRHAAVFHPTYYHLAGGLRYGSIKCPVVITVHDLAHAAYPQLMDDAEFTLRWQKEAIARADKIICVSKATEQDLFEHFPMSSGKTCVIHHGSSFPVCRDPQSTKIFDRPMFLFVGGRGGYKNFPFLLRAFAKAYQLNRDIRLHVAGPPLNSDEKWQIYFLGISDAVETSVFPDEDNLQSLYRQSVALLYPSRHEGFGMPPLEAMACGTIAVTANTTSLPEVVGDAGIQLDPAKEDDWADCIYSLSQPSGTRDNLIDRGYERAERFSWGRSAALHVEIYEQFR